MLEGKTRLLNTKTRSQGRVYDRFLLHIPSNIARDSQFPFEAGEALRIEVNSRSKLITLSKAPKARQARRT